MGTTGRMMDIASIAPKDYSTMSRRDIREKEKNSRCRTPGKYKVGLLWSILFIVTAAMFPRMAVAQGTTCYAVSEGFGGAWDDPTVWADTETGTGGTCNGANSRGYPNDGDAAVITTDIRIENRIDLTPSGEGPIQSLTLQSGNTANAAGTVLTFSADLEVTDDVINNAAGENNGLLFSSTDGTGNVTIGGDFDNSGNAVAGTGVTLDIVTLDALGGSIFNLGNGVAEVNVVNIEPDGEVDIGSGELTVLEEIERTITGVEGRFRADSDGKIIFDGSGSASGLSINGLFIGNNSFTNVDILADTEVDPDSRVEIQGDLDVKTDGSYGTTSSPAPRVTFNGSQFTVDGSFFSTRIDFNRDSDQGPTSVEGQVFAEVRATNGVDAQLSGDFTINGLLNLSDGILTVSTGQLTLLFSVNWSVESLRWYPDSLHRPVNTEQRSDYCEHR